MTDGPRLGDRHRLYRSRRGDRGGLSRVAPGARSSGTASRLWVPSQGFSPFPVYNKDICVVGSAGRFACDLDRQGATDASRRTA
jgi:hypothetical protein